ncbi:oxygenase MpaB family protein [Prescottella subtropica]|uniref:oxygenase MpaB family protein n=1 Tax=Prescottella subtropica TaxID=2545757 RepID=UPI0010F9F45F|nr:oxygenase MpaB family protein [Prescottella subtropica]
MSGAVENTGRDVPATRQDDGLFGPDSISWRLFADPASALGAVCGVLLQALEPGMMTLFSKVSVNYADSVGRAARTAKYLDTTVFGDTVHAHAAGESVRRMHAHAQWTDERTGHTLRADDPAWLEWTHHTLVWGILRSSEMYGPRLTPAERDRFVVEQHRAAELVGLDPSGLPRTHAELDTYIHAQVDRLAVTLPAAEATAGLRKPSLRGNPITVASSVVIQDGIIALLPDWARTMYGIAGRPMSLGGAARVTGWLMAAARRNKPYEKLIADMLTDVDAHPYRKVRAADGRRR